jgi:peptidoglycan/xylan/chitin deacetylase (PgdA/CDA1 family)
MMGGMLLKHTVKHGAGLAALAQSLWPGPVVAGTCVLMYHRVAEPALFDLSIDSWNVAPARLESQLRWLAEHAQCVPLAEALQERNAAKPSKPTVAVTFDDGFANFRHHALPLLQRYGIPATLFVVTRYVESTEPYPFDHWGQKNRARIPEIAWRPITWKEAAECLDSGLISLGSHSHNHFNARNLRDDQLAEEAGVSRECLRARLGAKAASLYAYPYGSSRLGQATAAYADAVRHAGYSMAVTTDLGLAQPNTPRFQIPRVEVHAYDSPRILEAKALGYLWPQSLCDRLRQAQRHAA